MLINLKFRNTVLRLIILLSFMPFVIWANPSEKPAPWPVGFWRSLGQSIGNTVDSGAYSATQAIFDGLDSLDARVFETSGVSAEVESERKVFDNQDILNSYTVIDKLSMRVDSRNLEFNFPTFTPNLNLGFRFGIGGSLDFTNIRQVTANRYSSLPTLEQEYSFLNSEGGETSEIDTYGQGYYIDPSLRPRVHRLWNLVSFPFRLPLTLKQLNKLENGELMSYGVSGYVELGPQVGFTVLPDFRGGSAGAQSYYRTFLDGHFRITVLKENDRFVRVKLSKQRAWGHRYGLFGDGDNFELFKGFMLFEGQALATNILQADIGLVPFNFSVEKRYSKTFDIGFRYDLSNEKAKMAFRKALFGSFALSHENLGRLNADGEKVIEKLFTKDSLGRRVQSQYSFDIKLFKKKNSRESNSIEATLTLPSGEHKVFRESKTMTREWRTLWGTSEKIFYNYTISLDKTAYINGKENSLQLIVEANINDSHTSGKEMRKYTQLIRSALGNKNLLPDLPIRVPRIRRGRNTRKKGKLARYRRSSFFYGFNINQEHLEAFLKTPPKRMWKILEKSFSIPKGQWSTSFARTKYRTKNLYKTLLNAPLFLFSSHIKSGSGLEVAKAFKKRWKKLYYLFKNKRKDDIDKKIKMISKLFMAKYHGHELLRVLLFSLKDQELDYFLVASNDSFGRISERGRVTTNPEYLLNLTDENIGFERLAGGFKSNPNILVKNLKTEVLENKKIKISFDLDHDAKILYFKIYRSNRFQKYKTKAELIFKNQGKFIKGYNEIIISKDSTTELEYILAKNLLIKNYYSLTLSSTDNGNSWSKVASSRFYLNSVHNE